MRHEGNVFIGSLEEYDLDHEIAIVKIASSLDVHVAFLYHSCHFLIYHDVVPLGRDTSRKLLTTTGKLTPYSGRSDVECLMFSSCKLSEVYINIYMYICIYI